MNSLRFWSRRAWILHGYLIATLFMPPFPILRAYWTDSDGNGVREEAANPAEGDSWWSTDSDGDLLTNEQEVLFGSDPYSLDSDRDGLTDYVEFVNSQAAMESGTPLPYDPWQWDTNANGFSDFDEYYQQIRGYEPVVNYTSLPGGASWPAGTFYTYSDADGDDVLNPDDGDPLNMDRDGDGILNWNEAAGQMDDASNGYTEPPPASDPGVIIGGTWYPSGTLDSDSDGTPDQLDPFPWGSYWYAGGEYAGNWADGDGDGIPDPADVYPGDPTNGAGFYYNGTWYEGSGADRDNDGIPDVFDSYPDDSTNNAGYWYGISWYSGSWTDADGDGIPDPADAYPNDIHNGSGYEFGGTWYDGSWMDADGDGIPDPADAYPYDASNGSMPDPGYTYNGSWYSGTWTDSDNDGIPDPADSYPNDANNGSTPDAGYTYNGSWYSGSWVDSDNDGIPDPADSYPNDADNGVGYSYNGNWYSGSWVDSDNDGIPDPADSYPYDANNGAPPDGYYYNGVWYSGTWMDSDNDGIPDSWDSYPYDANNGSYYYNGNWYAGPWSDRDNDGIPDPADSYPDDSGNNAGYSYNGSWYSGTWTDSDSDGIPDPADSYPYDANNGGYYYNGSWYSGSWSDRDNDGIPDPADSYPDDAGNNFGFWYNGTWYYSSWSDFDNDGIPDVADAYPYDSNNGSYYYAGTWYAGPWADADSDGIPDPADAYPWDSNNGGYTYNGTWYPGTWADYDNDGVPDPADNWVADPENGADNDIDGLTNYDERTQYGTNPDLQDTDSEGLTDYEEIYTWHTNPLLEKTNPNQIYTDYYMVDQTDTDQDGIPDRIEQWYATQGYGLDPADPNDANGDLDADGYTNLQAYHNGWNLVAAVGHYDVDADGILDVLEDAWNATYPGILSKADPNDAVQDFDSDGVMNFEEIASGMDPGNATTYASMADLQTWTWLQSLSSNSSWQVMADVDRNGAPDGLQAFAAAGTVFILLRQTAGDYDGDGMPDLWEHTYRFNLRDTSDATANPDGDSLTNLAEYLHPGRNPLVSDDPPPPVTTGGGGVDDDGDNTGADNPPGDGTGGSPTGGADTPEDPNKDSDGDGVPDSQDGVPYDRNFNQPKVGVPHFAILDLGEGSFADMSDNGTLLWRRGAGTSYSESVPMAVWSPKNPDKKEFDWNPLGFDLEDYYGPTWGAGSISDDGVIHSEGMQQIENHIKRRLFSYDVEEGEASWLPEVLPDGDDQYVEWLQGGGGGYFGNSFIFGPGKKSFGAVDYQKYIYENVPAPPGDHSDPKNDEGDGDEDVYVSDGSSSSGGYRHVPNKEHPATRERKRKEREEEERKKQKEKQKKPDKKPDDKKPDDKKPDDKPDDKKPDDKPDDPPVVVPPMDPPVEPPVTPPDTNPTTPTDPPTNPPTDPTDPPGPPGPPADPPVNPPVVPPAGPNDPPTEPPTTPPTDNPPTDPPTTPPTDNPPTDPPTTPPTDDPPADPPTTPPTDNPPTDPPTTPPGDSPPGDPPPGDQPPDDQPPADQPPGDQPPGDQPPGDQPQVGQPPANQPPADPMPQDPPPSDPAPSDPPPDDDPEHKKPKPGQGSAAVLPRSQAAGAAHASSLLASLSSRHSHRARRTHHMHRAHGVKGQSVHESRTCTQDSPNRRLKTIELWTSFFTINASGASFDEQTLRYEFPDLPTTPAAQGMAKQGLGIGYTNLFYSEAASGSGVVQVKYRDKYDLFAWVVPAGDNQSYQWTYGADDPLEESITVQLVTASGTQRLLSYDAVQQPNTYYWFNAVSSADKPWISGSMQKQTGDNEYDFKSWIYKPDEQAGNYQPYSIYANEAAYKAQEPLEGIGLITAKGQAIVSGYIDEDTYAAGLWTDGEAHPMRKLVSNYEDYEDWDFVDVSKDGLFACTAKKKSDGKWHVLVLTPIEVNSMDRYVGGALQQSTIDAFGGNSKFGLVFRNPTSDEEYRFNKISDAYVYDNPLPTSAPDAEDDSDAEDKFLSNSEISAWANGPNTTTKELTQEVVFYRQDGKLHFRGLFDEAGEIEISLLKDGVEVGKMRWTLTPDPDIGSLLETVDSVLSGTWDDPGEIILAAIQQGVSGDDLEALRNAAGQIAEASAGSQADSGGFTGFFRRNLTIKVNLPTWNAVKDKFVNGIRKVGEATTTAIRLVAFAGKGFVEGAWMGVKDDASSLVDLGKMIINPAETAKTFYEGFKVLIDLDLDGWKNVGKTLVKSFLEKGEEGVGEWTDPTNLDVATYLAGFTTGFITEQIVVTYVTAGIVKAGNIGAKIGQFIRRAAKGFLAPLAEAAALIRKQAMKAKNSLFRRFSQDVLSADDVKALKRMLEELEFACPRS